MHRKITRTGPATLTIALPAKWAKEHNLSAGQEIRLDFVEDNLLISPIVDDVGRVVRIPYNATLLPDMLRKLYKENVSTIIIHSEDVDPVVSDIRSVIDNFPGLKIVDEQKNKIVLSRILEPFPHNPSAVLRRVYYLIKRSLTHNPPLFSDGVDDLLLLNISEEYDLLMELYIEVKDLDKPVFDELYSFLRMAFNLLFDQKYSFNYADAGSLNGLFDRSESLFKKFSIKDPLNAMKIYYCLQLIKRLHKKIINAQSIDLLKKNKSSEKRFVVGVCLKNYSNKFWNTHVRGGMDKVALSNPDIGFVFRAMYNYPDISEQKKILEEFLSLGVDAIIVAPDHPKKLNPIFNRIDKAGIPLIIIDTDIYANIDYTYIGWNNYQGGVLTARVLNKLRKKGRVLIVEGHRAGNFHDRVTGFLDNSKHSSVIIQANFQQSEAYRKTLAFLKKSSVDAIYATSDNMAIGVLQALDELGLKVPVCGFDATPEGRELVKTGRLLSTIDDNPYKLGALAVETAVSILEKRVVADRIEYQVELVTRT